MVETRDGGPAPSPAPEVSPRQRLWTLGGVMIVFLLAALDQTIVSTAMPRIAAQLRGLSLYAWVTTAYLLASTVMVPIYGKLSDIYGRKPVLMAAIAIFTLGSGLCGLSGEFGRAPLLGGGMVQLIVFRGLQGIGGGGLFTCAFAVIADIFPPRERARYAALFGSMFGLASLLGPLIGGFLTQLHTVRLGSVPIEGWRWIFYVNLPLAAFTLWVIQLKMPFLRRGVPARIDWAGAALLVVGVAPLLLALSWGGREAPWGSPPVVGLFALAALGLAGFVYAEAHVASPILSLRLFQNRTFTTANLAGFFTQMAFLGSVTFLPLYMQLGLGASPTASGLAMLPLTGGLIVASAVNGLIITRTARFKTTIIVANGLIMLGLLLLGLAPTGASLFDLAWRMLILGFGLGPTQSGYSMAVQNAVDPRELGVATSASQFFRQIGATIGVAVFGALLATNLAAPPKAPRRGDPVAGRPLNLEALERGAVQQAVSAGEGRPAAVAAKLDAAGVETIAHAIRVCFFAGFGAASAGMAFTVLVPAARLRGREPGRESVAAQSLEESALPAGPPVH